jgi:hypothetical protein
VSCQHERCAVSVEVVPLVHDESADSAQAFMAEVRVVCADCEQPFGFKGVRCGLSLAEPMVSPDGLELRVPLMSPAEVGMRGPLAGLDQAPEGGTAR